MVTRTAGAALVARGRPAAPPARPRVAFSSTTPSRHVCGCARTSGWSSGRRVAERRRSREPERAPAVVDRPTART